MSDLQCPATFHILGPAAPLDGADAAAGSVYAARETAPTGAELLDESRPLWDVLEDLADLNRGRHVVVLPSRVVPPLAGDEDTVTVRIDADGRVVERP